MSYTSLRPYVAIIIAIFFSLQGFTYARDSSVPSALASLDQEKPTVLITGSNRGIGFAFVKHYSKDGYDFSSGKLFYIIFIKSCFSENIVEKRFHCYRIFN